MVKYYTPEMLFEDDGDQETTAEERELLEQQQTEYYSKIKYPEDMDSDDSIPYEDYIVEADDANNNNNNNNNNDDDNADDDDSSDSEDEFHTIEDFPELLEEQEKKQKQEIKPNLSRDDDAADVDAVKNVLEGIIQSPISTKNICGVHRLDQQILNKVLENLKNSITQETLNQLLAEEDNQTASPVPLQAPPPDKVQVHQQQDERKGKLTSYIPAAATVNNVSEEMTQLPASKKIRYAYDDGNSLKNLITQETSINLQNVSEQVADNETAFLCKMWKGDSGKKF